MGTGPITTITGTLNAITDADVYRVRVTDFALFRASLILTPIPPDTQIFLFDGDGYGIAFCDDYAAASSSYGELPVGNPLYNTRPPGDVLIAVTEWDLDPSSTGGPIFGQQYPGVFGATGAGASQPLSSWFGAAQSSPYNYTLTLEGCEYYHPPDMALEFNTMSVADGGTVNVGTVTTNGASFSGQVANGGLGPLLLTGSPIIDITLGANCAAGTVVQTQPGSATIAPSGSEPFAVYAHPAAVGPFSFTLSIANNDPAKNPYNITVNGDAVLPNDEAVANAAAGSSVTGSTDGPFAAAVGPGATLANIEIHLTDPEADNIDFTSVTPTTTAPTGIVPPAAPITGHPIPLIWTGVAEASNPPGPYTWQVDFADQVNGTPKSFQLTITINNLPPTHQIDAALSGNGMPGTPYFAEFTQGDTGAMSVNLATVSDPNTSQSPTLALVQALGGNPGGGAGFQFSLSGGVLSAMPAGTLVANDAGTHQFIVQISDGMTVASISVEILVYAASGSITFSTSTTLPDGVVNQPYAQSINVAGAALPVNFLLLSGNLHTGLTFNSNGSISGTPLATGLQTFEVRVRDSNNDTATGTFALTVTAQSTNPGQSGTGGSSGSGGCSVAGAPAVVAVLMPLVLARRRRRSS
jgi:hypothetical protein